jgi:hypothetical protein
MKVEIISIIPTGDKKRVIYNDVNGKQQVKDFPRDKSDDEIKKALGIPGAEKSK